MKTLNITGASDNLIEIDGAFREEFNPRDEQPSMLVFSDGTILRAVYDNDGIWRFNLIRGGLATYHNTPGVVADDTFDEVTLSGDNLYWVVFVCDGSYHQF